MALLQSISCCCNRIPESGYVIKERKLVLTFWDTEKSKVVRPYPVKAFVLVGTL
jgi:hypothetical protein